MVGAAEKTKAPTTRLAGLPHGQGTPSSQWASDISGEHVSSLRSTGVRSCLGAAVAAGSAFVHRCSAQIACATTPRRASAEEAWCSAES